MLCNTAAYVGQPYIYDEQFPVQLYVLGRVQLDSIGLLDRTIYMVCVKEKELYINLRNIAFQKYIKVLHVLAEMMGFGVWLPKQLQHHGEKERDFVCFLFLKILCYQQG